jgi:hypothetical protein
MISFLNQEQLALAQRHARVSRLEVVRVLMDDTLQRLNW